MTETSKLTTVFLGILVVLAVGFVLHHLQAVFEPLLVALFFSYILDPTITLLTKIKFPRWLAIVVALLLSFLVLLLLGLLVYASIASFAVGFPKYEAKMKDIFIGILRLLDIPAENVRAFIKQINWSSAFQSLSIARIIKSSVGSFVTFMFKLFLILVLAVYILMGRHRVVSRIARAFGERAENINRVISNINQQMQRYLVTKTLISLLTGILATAVLLIFDVEFAVVWGLLTFVLNFIPSIGSIIATFPPIIVAFFQFEHFILVVWVAILLVAIQQTIGNFIEPKVMGKSMDLSPLVVILSLILWGLIWGVVGMLLAVPIVSAIQIICANIRALNPVAVLVGGENCYICGELAVSAPPGSSEQD